MTDSKKKRMSMLDNLAGAGTPAPTAPMMSSNRALRSARDAVDSHTVWDLDPIDISDTRINDRLDVEDVDDLRDAIETNGQVVPILVRRHPTEPDRYLLVYGRRRLEAVRSSNKVKTVRALIANLDDRAALTNQISENMARRDLTYIEKARFAKELIDTGFGNQSDVAEVLTVTKSSISMAIAIAESVGPDLIQAIGSAQGIGRPRWDKLASSLDQKGVPSRDTLVEIAEQVHTDALTASTVADTAASPDEISAAAFDAVERAAVPALRTKATDHAPSRRATSVKLSAEGQAQGQLKRTKSGIRIDLNDGAFAAWVEEEAETLIQELHARWKAQAEEKAEQ